MNMHSKLLSMTLIVELLKVLVMKLHHIKKQINRMHIYLKIIISTAFVYNCKQGNKDLLSLFLINLAKIKLRQPSVQINKSL